MAGFLMFSLVYVGFLRMFLKDFLRFLRVFLRFIIVSQGFLCFYACICFSRISYDFLGFS